MQLCGSLNILWHCLSLGFEWNLTFSNPVASADFFLFLCIDHWGRLSYLSLLLFGTLHSDGCIFAYLLCLYLLFFSQLFVKGRQNEIHNQRKLTKLITWTTALSNSMKPWEMPCRATQDRQVMVESFDKTWSTGEGNGKTLQYSCLENPMSSMKRQRDTERWTPQVSRCPICYWRRVEKELQKEGRDRVKEKTTPSCGCDW